MDDFDIWLLSKQLILIILAQKSILGLLKQLMYVKILHLFAQNLENHTFVLFCWTAKLTDLVPTNLASLLTKWLYSFQHFLSRVNVKYLKSQITVTSPTPLTLCNRVWFASTSQNQKFYRLCFDKQRTTANQQQSCTSFDKIRQQQRLQTAKFWTAFYVAFF